MRMISLVVAMARNRVIGASGRMPWHLPADLRRFKEITLGRPIIMGRKTFESIGRPLPGRTNIVVSRRLDWSPPGLVVTRSLDEALEAARRDPGEVFVIGGGELFVQALPNAGRLYVTQIEADVEGDTRFPEIDPSVWRVVREEVREADAKNPYRCRFQVWERIIP
jgi:dihydrofolate reductase